MSLENMKKVIANIEDMCERLERTPYFYITGGDPILHPNFWDLMEIIREKGYKFTIMGNPFHLTDEVCQKLKACGCEKYQLSIDGMRKTHDSFRKPGSFDCTVEKIVTIRKAGIKCAIMSTVSNVNIDEMEDVVDLVVEHQADIFAFGRYCPTSEEKTCGIEPLAYRDFLDRIWKKYEAYNKQGVNTYFNLKDHLWTLYLYEKGIFKIPAYAQPDMIYDGCHCANCHMTILPNGDVYACRRFESKVGNVFEESLADIFVEKEEIYRDFDKFEKCNTCELRGFCRGCPAVTFGTTGDFYGTDPQCWKGL
jgi:radical SAM/SPASM domain protein of ACGX system